MVERDELGKFLEEYETNGKTPSRVARPERIRGATNRSPGSKCTPHLADNATWDCDEIGIQRDRSGVNAGSISRILWVIAVLVVPAAYLLVRLWVRA